MSSAGVDELGEFVGELDVGFEKLNAFIASAFDDQQIDGNLKFWVSRCAPTTTFLLGVRTSSFVWILPSFDTPPSGLALARFLRSFAARPSAGAGLLGGCAVLPFGFGSWNGFSASAGSGYCWSYSGISILPTRTYGIVGLYA